MTCHQTNPKGYWFCRLKMKVVIDGNHFMVFLHVQSKRQRGQVKGPTLTVWYHKQPGENCPNNLKFIVNTSIQFLTLYFCQFNLKIFVWNSNIVLPETTNYATWDGQWWLNSHVGDFRWKLTEMTMLKFHTKD